MPVNSDLLREERIKRCRRLMQAGSAHLVTLHEAVPMYIRQARVSEARLDELYALVLDDKKDELGARRARVDPALRRELDISMGVRIDDIQGDTYTRIYRWIDEANNAAERILSDTRFSEYTALGGPPKINLHHATAEATVEDQLTALSADIEKRLDVFGGQLQDDGEHEDVTLALRDAAGGWPHLRGRILPDAVLDGYLTRMRRRRTKAEIADSIGAAKEVVEATLKARAGQFGVTPTSTKPDLSDWWKVLKPHLVNTKVDKALGSTDGSLIKLLQGQVSTLQSLGELRNKVGSGHGKTAHPAGLSSAHALLAVDTAHTLTRFLAA